MGGRTQRLQVAIDSSESRHAAEGHAELGLSNISEDGVVTGADASAKGQVPVMAHTSNLHASLTLHQLVHVRLRSHTL